MALEPWSTHRDRGPFGGMRDMQSRINRLFDETFGPYPAIEKEPFEKIWSPLVDIYEDKNTVVVKAKLPGMKKEDISIEIKQSIFTLSGERKHEEEAKKKIIIALSDSTVRLAGPSPCRTL